MSKLILPNRRSLITGAGALLAYQWLRKPAHAALSINNLNGFGVRAVATGGPVTVTEAAAVDLGTGMAPSASCGIGTASADRYVVVGIGASSADAFTDDSQITSVTVAGQATTIIRQARGGAASRSGGMVITNAPVTTGTTATITVNFASSSTGTPVITWAVTGSADPSTAHDSATTSGMASSLNHTINIPAAGGACSSLVTEADEVAGYTGLTASSLNFKSTNVNICGGQASDMAEEAARSITGSGTNCRNMISASFPV